MLHPVRGAALLASSISREFVRQARWQTNVAASRQLSAEQERLERVRHLGDFGQPSPATHPGHIRETEVTRGICKSEYEARRAAFAAHMPPDSVAVLCAAPSLFYSGTVIPVPTAYRQHGDFLYYTGVTQPGCIAVIEKPGDAVNPRFTLLTPPPDPWHTTWNGPRLTADAAVEFMGADAADEAARMPAVIEQALSRTANGFVLWDGPHGGCALSAGVDKVISNTCTSKGRKVAAAVGAISSRLRWVKSPAEIALMRSAAAASAAGIAAAAAVAQPGVSEEAAAAAHQWQTRIRGAQRLSFPTVAGSGPNATYIHYSRSDRTVEAGDLFLMDAGCEMHGYVSDVTRTWPVSGKFSGAQRDLYGHVLEAHTECLKQVREGATLKDVHDLSVSILSKAIVSLGLAGRLSAETVAKGAYRRFYPHSVGHWLGLDTHDTPGIPLSSPLVEGVVLTIEPGLYIPLDAEDVPAEFRGLGVRIEDDVLLTKGKADVLSAAAPVGVGAIEAFAEEGRRRFPWLAGQAKEAAMAAAAEAAPTRSS